MPSRSFSADPSLTGLGNAINTACRIYYPARSWSVWSKEAIEEEPYHPRVAIKVLGLAFMGLVSAWEDFVEQCFLRYLCGARTSTGYAPKLRLGPCKSLSHAAELLQPGPGPQRLLRWSDYDWVKTVAAVHFVGGKPFSTANPELLPFLADAQHIRNRVAHTSIQARKQFKRVANRLRSVQANTAMPTGYSPGMLLRSGPSSAFPAAWLQQHDLGATPDNFGAFLSLFWSLASHICPVRSSA